MTTRAEFEKLVDNSEAAHLSFQYNSDVDHCKATRAALLAAFEEAQRDAERFKWGVKNARWIRHEHEQYVAIPVDLGLNLENYAARVAAIDAAMKESNTPEGTS